MKNQTPPPANGKPVNTPPLPFITLLTHTFFFVFGLTLGVIFCFHYKSFSFNLQVSNGQFSFFTRQSLPSPPSSPPPPPNQPPPPPPYQPPPPPPNNPPPPPPNNPPPPPPNNPPPPPPNQPPPPPPVKGLKEYLKPPPVEHGFDDRELMWLASMAPKVREYPFPRVPKIAFMFLTRGPVLLAPLWEMFFKGHDGLFSIYIHSDPGFNGSEIEGSVFFGRRIASQKVEWGDVNMVEAERRLLANALLDISNQQFVLLSESCIPLHNFTTIYSYLTNSTQSFIESYDLPGPVGRGRYSHHMAPTIKLETWRKGSQWFAVGRGLALEIISDNKYFPVFKDYCKGSCYADEHYLPTFMNVKFGSRNSNRTLTWVDWSRGGPHPAKFIRTDVSMEFLEKLRSGGTCQYNGETTNLCFLFARKFTVNSLDRLVRFAPKIMQFNS